MKSVITEDELTGLIQENRREMYYFAMSMIANSTEAQDVVGEAIMRAFEHRHQLRKKDSAKAWLRQIVANEAKKILRGRKRIVSLDAIALEQSSEEGESYEDVWHYIQALPSPFQSVTVLYYYDQLSVEEIAKILNVSAGTVKSRLSRSRSKLAEMMERDGYSYE